MSFSKIAAAFRRGSAAFLAFPIAGTVAPSYSTVHLAAEALDNR